ncbi:DUF5391 family protein [Viridibacillus sp. YIM B01967]|uniref:DUF5391 family protein n=1 Tax=Viridibacillus soli TaxID=2798301 RepID=A0ABS1H5R9_9BACL|nr:DUF5391 family protein [Viridibacillus soli]MBK3494730.1 DUF5391 family protein [Viridibacillus soli]
MSNKKSTIIMTIFSAVLFSILLVTISLSPLSKLGPNANKFGSLDMWMSVGKILVFYVIPLLIYIAGMKWMKYVMAVLCALGLFIFVAILGSSVVIGLAQNNIPQLIGVFIVGSLDIIINSIWFFVAFRSKGHESSPAVDEKLIA